MKCKIASLCVGLLVAVFSSQLLAAGGGAIPGMLQKYERQGAHGFSADGVAALWDKKVMAKDGKLRSCSTCHGVDLTQTGKHARTGKLIKPMALSVNAERFIKAKKIRKWFKRNCKWAWGRECTAQEKGNFLTFFKGQ